MTRKLWTMSQYRLILYFIYGKYQYQPYAKKLRSNVHFRNFFFPFFKLHCFARNPLLHSMFHLLQWTPGSHLSIHNSLTAYLAAHCIRCSGLDLYLINPILRSLDEPPIGA